MPADERTDEPDPRVVWRWIGDALRPWVGWILIGAGALCMLMGYFGVSRESIPAKQIPYLVSGGIGGIFLAVLGAYFLGTQEMRNDSGRLDRLERMVEDLHQALLTRADAPQLSNGSAAATADGTLSAPARKVVAVPGGQLFHRAECAMAEGKAGTELTPAAARKRGMRPCPTCAPVASLA
ncbi:MAG: hypothetical protein QOI61_1171 [Actinomycetota bacterium]|jgi:hypothetical protein